MDKHCRDGFDSSSLSAPRTRSSFAHHDKIETAIWTQRNAAMNHPLGNQNTCFVQGASPGLDMFINAVDEGSVEIKQDSGRYCF